jgi:hypothetical protein
VVSLLGDQLGSRFEQAMGGLVDPFGLRRPLE